MSAEHRAARLVPLGFLGLFLLLTTYKAWVSDDAFITFRVVDNLFLGHGLTWNPPDRVQVYTHPLWMLLVAASHLLTREFYYTSMAMGIVLSLAALWIVAFRISTRPANAAVAIVVLLASRAFTDYSTSGLENPLTHLLLALFALGYVSTWQPLKKVQLLSLIAGLLVLSRPDAVLLVLPALALVVSRRPTPATGRAAASGLLPLLLWWAFAFVYYGFVLPNSALAKLGTDLPVAKILGHGAHYFANSLAWDPVTLVAIAGSLVLGIMGWRTDRERAALALGIFLYLVYVWWIGGDFMSGRFFTAPLFVAAIVLARATMPPRLAVELMLGAGVLALVPWALSTRAARGGYLPMDQNGIADERAFYFSRTGLRHAAASPWPLPRLRQEAARLRASWYADERARLFTDIGLLPDDETWPPGAPADSAGRPYDAVVVRGAVGALAFYMGAEVHVVDFYAITDPLLARLPARPRDPLLEILFPRLGDLDWRVGHFARSVPRGYLRTLATGKNTFEDEGLAGSYDTLARVTRGPLFSASRWRAILDLHLGRQASALRAYAAREAAQRTRHFDYAAAHRLLGTSQLRAGNFDRAVDHLERALVLEPRDAETLNNLAWILATCPAARLRDGDRALELVQRALDVGGGVATASLLDTFAAAYAERGDFPQAVSAAEQALQRARSEGNRALVRRLEARLDAYRNGRPYRMPAPQRGDTSRQP